MLENTFLHLPGIGQIKEVALWRAGILTWDDFERHFFAQGTLFKDLAHERLAIAFAQSRDALESGQLDYFAARLPKQEHYRIALHDPKGVIFVDIETTGLSQYYDHITLIGASGSGGYQAFINGGDIGQIAEIFSRASCVVTFNGTMFDLKFLKKEFPELRIPKAQVDLRFFGIPVGLRGTQKAIERQLNFSRPVDIEDVSGEAAPILWHSYTTGDMDAGRRLIEYNYFDIEGMRLILDVAIERKLAAEPYRGHFSRPPQFHSAKNKLQWATTFENQRPNRVYLPIFRGTVGPRTTYSRLISSHRFKDLKVVGIDLTGSEKRPTGWCLLAGNRAVTKLLHTDKDLIEETIAATPDLVSIDSPLSLPKGRKSVRNDDPGREKYGIMRECERILKRRGVNVYPCLIDSMQNLTARGIRIATKFRNLGIPVIESYPGAAQDIMGIPRKRAGLNYLKSGLAEFGISGTFIQDSVRHDEVDAITAAIVGLFFWSGKFEPLGNYDEEFLIVPKLNATAAPWTGRLVVGMSGPIASGKTTGAEIISGMDFAYGRYSQVLAEILKKKGVIPNRDTLQALGNRIHRNPGQRWFSRQVVLSMPDSGNLVIDGLRFPEDHSFLVESFGPAYTHIHVTAPESVRKERYIKAGGSAREFELAIRQPVESQIPRVQSLANFCVSNAGSKKSYGEQLSTVIEALRRCRSESPGETPRAGR